MKEEKTYIVVDNVAEEEAKKFWKQIDNLQERINKATELTNNLLKTEPSGYYQIIFKKQLDILQGKDEN